MYFIKNIIIILNILVIAWHEIKAFAEDVLREHNHPFAKDANKTITASESEDRILKRALTRNEKKLTRTKSLRFSFTRSISKDMYKSHSDHLRDGCTSILVVNPNHQEKPLLNLTDSNNNFKSKT